MAEDHGPWPGQRHNHDPLLLAVTSAILPDGTMGHMPVIPESTRSSVILRLLNHAEKNWLQLGKVQARYHGAVACITGVLPGGNSSSASARFAS